MQPSDKQLNFAQNIAQELDVALPKNAPIDRKICSTFINAHKEKFYQKLKKNDKSPSKFIENKPGEKRKPAHLVSKEKIIHSDPKNSKFEKHIIIKYWNEGLKRTAFDDFGKLESVLNDVQTFSFDKIEYILNNSRCKNLQDLSSSNEKEATIRHLVMMLESTKAAQTGRTDNIVLLIFPLVINSDEVEHPAGNIQVPYVWQRATDEFPIFNHRLLGEEAEIEGFQLHNNEALEKLLLNTVKEFPENASIHQCLLFIDRCFNELTGKDHGCIGWMDEFTANQNNYTRLRNKQIRLKLVDGGAVSGATRNIRLCYEELLGSDHVINSPPLGLLKNLLGQEEEINKSFPQPFTINEEKQGWYQLGQYLGHMDNHIVNNDRSCYPLDPSQRIALTLFKKVSKGNLLAVNGPPGTGKTSLLRAIIADEWIRPLISEEEFPDCPIIIACAATNQAVTNIISSFDSVPGSILFDKEGERTNHSVSLESRWLPHLVSYGWYQPASIGKNSKEYQGFQVISRKSPQQAWEFNFAAKDFGSAEKKISYLEYCYLAVAREFFNQNDTLPSIAEKFRTKIKETVKEMDDISCLLSDWKENLSSLINLAKNICEKQDYYELLKCNFDLHNSELEISMLNSKIENIKTQLTQLFNLRDELHQEFSTSFYRSFIRFIKNSLWNNKSIIEHDNLGNSLSRAGYKLPKDNASFKTCITSIDEELNQLNNQLRASNIELDNLLKNNNKTQKLLEEFEKKQQDYLLVADQGCLIGKRITLKLEHLGNTECKEISKTIEHTYQVIKKKQEFDFNTQYQLLLNLIQNWLDIHIRPKLFHISARYWEARYLMYKKSISNKNNETLLPSLDRIRELAMLAPVFVTTSYSAPKLMRCTDEDRLFNYLYGAAELLIVDEAGQGTSEIGGCTFAFAKRAIVVGDTQQLSPVWSINKAVDKLIHKKLNIPQDINEMKAKGLLMSSGSIMQMAQSGTAFYELYKDVPGVMLTNHYRCRSPIIEICNEMVYAGELTVVSAATEPKKEWRLPLGFLVVPGDSTRLNSGSRCNIPEAECIARWLKEQAPFILEHYNNEKSPKGLADLIAILTPFKGQVNSLRNEIAKVFGENLKDNDAVANKMVIGTVHSLQGSERAIVIFSMVDTANPEDNHFYDSDSSLINVAISRAKEVFIVAMDQKSVNYGRSLTRKKLSKPSDYLFYHMVNNGQRLNSRRLLFIESPNKRTHLETVLSQGLELEIISTNGHLTQLDPSSDWDPLSAEEPKWLPLSDKEALIYQRAAVLWPDLEALYIATDPDAEGECIAWQFINRMPTFLSSFNQNARQPVIKRMRFNNLGSKDIQAAYEQASDGLDAGLVKSALFRAILDQILSRHYPAKLGLGLKNSFHAGIGRVQLSILDIAHRFLNKEEEYYIEVALPIPELNHFGNFILFQSDNMTPILFSDPLQAKNTADKLAAILIDKTQIKFSWKGTVEQLPEYPAINTANFLALACKTHDLTPLQVMNILQTLYEGQNAVCNEVVMEQPG
ncbi:MAG: hypothetical protein H0U70_07490 [Tatlockia sp.]|nr:hypothetical protein [Tatlockia sp.]